MTCWRHIALACGALLLLALPRVAGADMELRAAQFRIGSRYDAIDFGKQRNRGQATIRMGLRLQLVEGLEIVSVASSGPKYTSAWTTLYNRDGSPADDFRLYARHLYLESRFHRFRLQLGTIPPVKDVVSSTGLRALGWIDGGRIEFDYGPGILEVVAGQISDLDNPDTLSRDKGFNYFEIEVSHEVNEHLLLEGSFDYLSPSPYARSELRLEDILSGRGDLNASAEAYVNLDNQRPAWALSTSFDVLDLWLQRYPGRLELEAAYGFVSQNIGLRGELTDDFYTYGHFFRTQMDGSISRRYGLGWFVRNTIASPWRFDAGLNFKFKYKAPARQAE